MQPLSRWSGPIIHASICIALIGLASAPGHASDAPLAANAGAAAFVSDNFDCAGSALVSAWEFVNPTGDAATATRSGGALVISAVSASTYSAFTAANTAPAVLQSVPNGDFVIEAKLASTFAGTNQQTQGLMIEESPTRFLRFDFSNLDGEPFLFAAVVNVGGQATQQRAETSPPGISLDEPLFLRITRAGDEWTLHHSVDGESFTQWHSFTEVLAVSRVGVFIEKDADTPFAARFDYVVEVHPDGPDCDGNQVVDGRDVAGPGAFDCNGNAVLDGCEGPPDCNNNGIDDADDVAAGSSGDCNANGLPDECDVAAGTSPDVNSNGVPDGCDECLADADCADDVWCNGQEICASGVCVAGAPPCDQQTGERCNEENRWCETCTDGCAPVCTPTLAVMLLGISSLRFIRRRRTRA